MFRTIINRLGGRKKTLDESLDFYDTFDRIAQMDSNTEISVTYCMMVINKLNPKGAGRFIKGNFNFPGMYHYTDVRHQVFSGKEDEKHYLDLKSGRLVHKAAYKEPIKQGPSNIVTFSWREEND